VCVNIWIQANALRKFGRIEISAFALYYNQAMMWEDELGFFVSKNF